MEYRYTSVILKKRDIGECDRLYTFYSRESGKIQAFARGIRKPSAKLAGQLENFSTVSLIVMRSRGAGNIKSAFCEYSPIVMKSEFNTLRSSFFAAEMIDRLIETEEPDVRIFDLIIEFFGILETLAQDMSLNKVLLMEQGFLFRLLRILGYALEVQSCVRCLGKIREHIHGISFFHGGILCETCVKDASNAQTISSETIKLLRIFENNSLPSLLKLHVSDSVIRETRRIGKLYVEWVEK